MHYEVLCSSEFSTALTKHSDKYFDECQMLITGFIFKTLNLFLEPHAIIISLQFVQLH